MRGRAILVALLALLATGCTHQGPLEEVRIVAIDCEPQMGIRDCVTYVEFPNGERVGAKGKAGEVGDTFRARLHTNTTSRWWE